MDSRSGPGVDCNLLMRAYGFAYVDIVRLLRKNAATQSLGLQKPVSAALAKREVPSLLESAALI